MRMPFHVDLKKGCLHSLKRTNLVHVEPFPHWLEHIHKRTQKQTDAHTDKLENVICHFTLSF